MFGFAPPQLTEEQMKEMETQANFTVQQFTVTAVVLYISPFVVDAVYKLF